MLTIYSYHINIQNEVQIFGYIFKNKLTIVLRATKLLSELILYSCLLAPNIELCKPFLKSGTHTIAQAKLVFMATFLSLPHTWITACAIMLR